MKEGIRKSSLILTFWTLLGAYLWWWYQQSETARAIEKNGVAVRAKVIERHYAKGWVMNIECQYAGKKYVYYAATSKFIPEVGDSLIIKILPSEPDKAVLVKERFFSVLHKS